MKVYSGAMWTDLYKPDIEAGITRGSTRKSYWIFGLLKKMRSVANTY